MIYTKNNDDWFVIKHKSSGLYLTFESLGNLNVRSLTTDVELDIDRGTHENLVVNHDLSNAQNTTLILEEPQDQTPDNEMATTEQKLFSCTICTKVFKANRYLTKHMKNVHEGKNPKQSKVSSNHDDFDQMIDVENSISNENQLPNVKPKRKTIPRLVTEKYQGVNYTCENNVYLHDDGHSYHKYKMNKTETTGFLRCQFSKFKNRQPCKGTAKLDIHLDKIFNGQGHSHDSNDFDIQVFRFKNKVRNECERHPGKGANKIYNELRIGVPVEVQIKAPFTMLESSLYARGRKIHPKLPHTLEDVQKALEMEPNKDVFKYLKSSVKYSSKFGGLIFGKDDLIAAFENTTDAAQDGTFKSCPTPFAQVYIMYFRKGRYFLPAFIIPLANKQQKLYISTFRIVYKKLAPGFKGKRVHQDFELASKNATEIVLNECSCENEDRACLADCQCTGCHFHYRLIILKEKVYFIILFF